MPAPFTQITLKSDAVSANLSVLGGAAMTSVQGYTYDVSWMGGFTPHEPDITHAPPGFSDLAVDLTTSYRVTSTTPGREAPGTVLYASRLLAMWTVERPVCQYLQGRISLGETTYCAVAVGQVMGGAFASGVDLRGPLTEGQSVSATYAGLLSERIADADVTSFIADLNLGPNVWVLGTVPGATRGFPGDIHDGNADADNASCAVPGGWGQDDLWIVWSSGEMPGCAVPLTGAGPATGLDITQLVSAMAANQDAEWGVCPLGNGETTLDSLALGVAGLDANLALGVSSPSSVPMVSCGTPRDAPGGVLLAASWSATEWSTEERRDAGVWGSLGAIEAQQVADNVAATFGRDYDSLAIAGPFDVRDGVALLYRQDDGRTWVTWTSGQLSLGASLAHPVNSTTEERMARTMAWLQANLPAILNNLADSYT